MQTYQRVQWNFDQETGVDRILFTRPDQEVETAPAFADQPVVFSYDVHGFETTMPEGPPRLSVRYTPVMAGTYQWQALSGDKQVESGGFTCTESDNPGFVEISRQDKRYFALSDGSPYVPIGLNMVGVTQHPLPAGDDHFERSGSRTTCGMLTWRRWLGQLAENGGNYARIWLSQSYTEGRTEVPGQHDLVAFARTDALVEEARRLGIRLKLCLDHFRHFDRPGHFAQKVLRDPDSRQSPASVQEWIDSPRWRSLWLADAAPYLARYWNDPIVFSWELWNEMNAVDADFDSVCDWTAYMLPKIKEQSPRNLVVNSLGSTDTEQAYTYHRKFQAIPLMEFDQIHRYLDQGAPLEICRTDPVAFSIESVQVGSGKRPVILTETGAVDDRHIGPFRFYDNDHDGLVFIDTTYPAFFAGAAGSGHIWHWNEYVERKNLWRFFQPLANLLADICPDQESFQPVDQSTEQAWVLGLEGKSCSLWFVRSRADRWDHVLRDSKLPACIESITIQTEKLAEVEVWGLCDENVTAAAGSDSITIGSFRHGCVLRGKARQHPSA